MYRMSSKKTTIPKKTSKKKSSGFPKEKKTVIAFKNFLSKSKDNNKCIKENFLDEKILIKNRIGTDSAYGEVFLGCFPKSCTTKLAIKKIAFTDKEYSLKDDPFNLRVLNYSESWAEIYFLKLCGELFEQGISLNVPKYYKYYLCNSCDYANLAISDRVRNYRKCAIIPVDLADGDFKLFINSDQNIYSLFCAYFQIFMGIFTLQRYFNMRHNDLHYGNVLFKKVKKGLYEYVLDGKKYYVENNGINFYLWDFGMATIPGTVEHEKNTETEETVYDDYLRILSMVIPGKGDANNKEIGKYIYLLIKTMIDKASSPKDLMISYLTLISSKTSGSAKVVGVCNLDKKLQSKTFIS